MILFAALPLALLAAALGLLAEAWVVVADFLLDSRRSLWLNT